MIERLRLEPFKGCGQRLIGTIHNTLVASRFSTRAFISEYAVSMSLLSAAAFAASGLSSHDACLPAGAQASPSGSAAP